MSRICALCEKKSIKAITLVKLRGKYNPTATKRKYPNLQWLTLPNGKRIKACAKCIKTMAKKKK
jgi:ribosomal protein L28